MRGRKNLATTPLPFCKNGHRRTKTVTRWATVRMYGNDYLQIRCLICKAAENRLRYKKKKEAALGLSSQLASGSTLAGKVIGRID